eukprot:TRINITY_DN12713_c0_g1_i25.p1 TRINITY_DN12713_c0_g1~~TRINITY_DN12713_c0_g1_i25.p1  ORF type:complete len:128 (+),score=12.48 TRINITY_DN12713_c0_g1_i25:120-503(+)
MSVLLEGRCVHLPSIWEVLFRSIDAVRTHSLPPLMLVPVRVGGGSSLRDETVALGGQAAESVAVFSSHLESCRHCKARRDAITHGGSGRAGQFSELEELIASALPGAQIGRAVQQECRDRSRMPSSA